MIGKLLVVISTVVVFVQFVRCVVLTYRGIKKWKKSKEDDKYLVNNWYDAVYNKDNKYNCVEVEKVYCYWDKNTKDIDEFLARMVLEGAIKRLKDSELYTDKLSVRVVVASGDEHWGDASGVTMLTSNDIEDDINKIWGNLEDKYIVCIRKCAIGVMTHELAHVCMYMEGIDNKNDKNNDGLREAIADYAVLGSYDIDWRCYCAYDEDGELGEALDRKRYIVKMRGTYEDYSYEKGVPFVKYMRETLGYDYRKIIKMNDSEVRKVIKECLISSGFKEIKKNMYIFDAEVSLLEEIKTGDLHRILEILELLVDNKSKLSESDIIEESEREDTTRLEVKIYKCEDSMEYFMSNEIKEKLVNEIIKYVMDREEENEIGEKEAISGEVG